MHELNTVFDDRSIKRQQDSKLKQMDRFETSVKTATDAQRQWKQRVLLKQSEIDSVKVRRCGPDKGILTC